MSKRKLIVGAIVAVSVLAIGALVLWALPGDAQAWRGSSRGNAECAAGTCLESDEAAGAGYRGGRGNMGGGMQQGMGLGVQGGAGLNEACGICGEDSISGSLTDAEVGALTAALQDEHNAKALYEQAVADLGNVRPITQIARAEERHVAAIERVFARYGLEVPTVEAAGQGTSFATLADACAAGVTVEEANVALYDRLLAQVEKADVTRVLTSLQRASQSAHLPALEACAP